MLIDQWLPRYDVVERHETWVAASPQRVDGCVRDLDLARSPFTAGLLLLRRLPSVLNGGLRPSRRATLEDLLSSGFVILADAPGEEIVLGLVGRFWRPGGGIVHIRAEGFEGFAEPGHARAAWNFRIDSSSGGCRLRTETRIDCVDAAALWRFRVYWTLVGPFSGLIRRDLLRLIRREAENESPGIRPVSGDGVSRPR
ncbi:MAG: hypothetical protein E6J14_07165 [Chloroflexi bacterium]|nr:MAG: hypothetical protein E6J14_07165 [Chloroflexota bacterium]